MANEATEGTAGETSTAATTTDTANTTSATSNNAATSTGAGETKANEPTRLPDDHPLVKAYNATKNDLTAAKTKVKEFEDRDKSDAEKAADQLREAQEARDKALSDLARARAAVKHGLTEDDLELLGDGTPEEIEARAERLAARLADGKTTRKPDPSLGRTEETRPDPDAWLRAAARR
jgi:hypothetical protein